MALERLGSCLAFLGIYLVVLRIVLVRGTAYCGITRLRNELRMRKKLVARLGDIYKLLFFLWSLILDMSAAFWIVIYRYFTSFMV